MPPACALLAPCQTNASPGNPRAWRGREASAFGVATWITGQDAHVRVSRPRSGALGVPAERSRGVSGRSPVCRGRVRLAALLRRSHAACMLPPCALPDERLARKPPCVARQGSVRLRRCYLDHRPRRARARLAAAKWGSRGPRGAVAWGSGRSPVCRGRVRVAALLRQSHAADPAACSLLVLARRTPRPETTPAALFCSLLDSRQAPVSV